MWSDLKLTSHHHHQWFPSLPSLPTTSSSNRSVVFGDRYADSLMLWRLFISCEETILFHSTMNFSFLNNWPILRLQSNTESETETKLVIVKSESRNFVFWNVKHWERSFQSLISWAVSLKNSVWSRAPMSSESEMPRYPRSYAGGEPGCPLPRFRPYVAKVPWHRGARGFLSQLFPRYGHYCGPNWSSGKDNGLPLWDKRPIDWLDFCCYCHDIGYDTHDQERLLNADLAFLECLEKPRTRDTKGDPRIALLYQTMCITGLRTILIPYRTHLVRLQSGPSLGDWIGSWSGKNSLRTILVPYRTNLVRLQSVPSLADWMGSWSGKNNACQIQTDLNHRS